MSANDIRQDFDIAGFIDVRVNTSGPFQRSVSCVYDTYQLRVCHVECFDLGDGGGGSNGGHGGGGGRGDHFDIRNVGASTLDHRSCREVCHYETHYIYDRYEEEYNITTRERVCEFQLTDKNTRNQIGSFRGSQGSSSYETVLHRGYCHL